MRTLPRLLSYFEVAEMFNSSSGKELVLLKCLYYLGLKNSEAQSLKTVDIDLMNNVVKVSQGKKGRLVPIPGQFGDELRQFISGRSGFLFEGRSEGKLSDRHIRRIVKESAIRANIHSAEQVHPQTLRHSYASHLQESGVPLNVIQSILGHARISSTRIYSKPDLARTREWIDRFFEASKRRKYK